ncbi:hypothetical protein BH24ACT11_BH24ACT11_05090 [soil metagenome]
MTGSASAAGVAVQDLVAVMDRLRSPGGCPWDARQTHASLATYLLEETYEVLEALDSGDRQHLREELGDLLLQVVFHTRLAEEHPDDPWGIDEVAKDIVHKLVARHPHVFAGAAVDGAEEVEANWDAIKAAEKQRTSLLDGIPAALPALADRGTTRGVASAAGAPRLDSLSASMHECRVTRPPTGRGANPRGQHRGGGSPRDSRLPRQPNRRGRSGP